MRKLTLNPEVLTVQSFRTTSPELAQSTVVPQIPDSPWCVPSMGNCTY
ncbi:MAG TPA: hypothetical protein VFT45_22015 [Longimicrobium sp.]|nr:hypothetical protein [Longimicrobium sp.]